MAKHLFKGKTYQKALSLALSKLKVPRSELIVSIKQKESKGFLGIGERDCIIEVEIKNESCPDFKKQSFVKGKHGTVEVRENKIIVKNPEGLGDYPTITPCEGINLYVNSIKVDSTIVVSEDDTIEVRPEKEEAYCELSIDVSSDKMKAYLSFEKKNARFYKLIPQGPVNHLKLKVESVKEENKITTELLKQIMIKLNELGITFGIKYDKIEKLIKETKVDREVIAEGILAKDGKDSFVEFFFNENSTPQQFSVKEDGRIDFREKNNMLSVDPGTLLAIKHPPQKGEIGMNIFGEKVLPKDGQDIPIKPGKGVKLLENGTKAVSSIAGRPVLKNSGIIEVIPIYVHPGDVDMASGNINFDGDVKILGNVNEGMKVTAGGYVDINGNVNQGKVEASGSIMCKNIIAGEIRAGGQTAIYNSMLQYLTAFFSELNFIEKKVENIIKENSVSYVDCCQESKLLRTIIGLKSKKIETLATKIISLTEKDNLPGLYKKLGLKLKNNFLGIKMFCFDSFDSFCCIKKQIELAIKETERNIDNEAHIDALYVQNSILESSGSIFINGKGCYNTIIHAGRDVYISGKPGVFKGGEIIAGKKVIIKEVGSPLGVYTFVKVSSEGEIKFTKVHPNVKVMIGDYIHKFTDTDDNIWCRISNNRLKIK